MTLQEKLADLKAQVAKLEAQIANKRWKPERNDQYWRINAVGIVSLVAWKEDGVDEWNYSTRNVFRTREEAEKAHNLLMVRYELMDLADEAWGDTVIDWEDRRKNKYEVSLDSGELAFYGYNNIKTQGTIYFPSEESYRAAIQKIGEERFIEFVKEGL